MGWKSFQCWHESSLVECGLFSSHWGKDSRQRQPWTQATPAMQHKAERERDEDTDPEAPAVKLKGGYIYDTELSEGRDTRESQGETGDSELSQGDL